MAVMNIAGKRPTGSASMQPGSARPGATTIAKSVVQNQSRPFGTGRVAGGFTDINWVYANSSGSSANLVIGDATGMVAALLGRTVVSPDSTSTGITVANQKANFAVRPLLISELNLTIAAASNQFAQVHQFIFADQFGGGSFRPLVLTGANSRQDYNTLTTTIDVQSAGVDLVLSDYSGLYITVLNGVTLTVTARVSQYLGQG